MYTNEYLAKTKIKFLKISILAMNLRRRILTDFVRLIPKPFLTKLVC